MLQKSGLIVQALTLEQLKGSRGVNISTILGVHNLGEFMSFISAIIGILGE